MPFSVLAIERVTAPPRPDSSLQEAAPVAPCPRPRQYNPGLEAARTVRIAGAAAAAVAFPIGLLLGARLNGRDGDRPVEGAR